jgi:hypothetical protein
MAIFAHGPHNSKDLTSGKLPTLPGKTTSVSSGSSGSSSAVNCSAATCMVFERELQISGSAGAQFSDADSILVDTDCIKPVAVSSLNGEVPSLLFNRVKPFPGFPVAVYKGGLLGSQDRLAEGYPAIPLSPTKLQHDIRSSGTRVEKLEIHFRNAAGVLPRDGGYGYRRSNETRRSKRHAYSYSALCATGYHGSGRLIIVHG